MTAIRPAVTIVGAGPTGLAAGLFLAARGIISFIADRSPEPSETSRAQVVNPRSLELLEPVGVSERILAEGHSIDGVRFYENWKPLAALNFGELPSHYPMTVIPQARTEALLTEALARHGVTPEREMAFTALEQTTEEVRARFTGKNGEIITTSPLLLAADGAHSTVRTSLHVTFEGNRFPEAWPLFDIELNDPLAFDYAHVNFVENGLVFLLGTRHGLWRVFGDIPDVLARLPGGSRCGEVMWKSSFHIADRLAGSTCVGRVAFAGDAAHVHSPVGARGMNLGIEDAHVFAACAADVLNGQMERIADYGGLRHSVHETVVSRMDKLTTLARGHGWMSLLRHYLMPALTDIGPLARGMQAFITGLDQPVRVR